MSDQELINLFTNYQISLGGSSHPSVYANKKGEMQGQIKDLRGEINILEGKRETYNEIYMNAKKNPSKFGLFSGLGLQTTQDWVLAYFYFSYILFSILLISIFMKISQTKTTAAAFIFTLTLAVGVLSTIAILSYA